MTLRKRALLFFGILALSLVFLEVLFERFLVRPVFQELTGARGSNPSYQSLLLSMLIVAVFAVILVCVLADRLVFRRLNRLQRQVESIGIAGQPDVRVALDGNDDLSALALAINGMLEALQTSNTTLLTVIVKSPIAIITLDMALCIRSWNPAAERLLGWTAEEVVGKYLPMVPEEWHDESLAFHRRLLQGEPSIQTVVRRQRKDGVLLDLSLFATFLRGTNGEVIGLLLLYTDPAASRELAASFHDQETRFRLLSDRAPIGIFQLDTDGRCLYANPHLLGITGRAEAELLGEGWHQCLLEKDHAALLARGWHAVPSTLGWDDDHRIRDRHGNVHWVHVHLNTIYAQDGQPIGYIGTLKDITARKQAEEAIMLASQQWQVTFDAIGDPVVLLDLHQTILRSNQATADFLGLPSAEIVGCTCYELFHPATPKSERCPCEIAKRTHARHTADFQFGERWMRMTVDPVFDAQDRITALVHVSQDITERKHAAERDRQRVSQLQQMTESIITALAKTLEARDPYTAGHQEQVSRLAYAIARDMGLSGEQCLGVRTAGLLHDVGKIHVPSELLTKPGKLTPLEFSLVQTHTQYGFEILSAIEFPWPIASIVLQHHERLDGSGYPHGLRDGDILLEARILAVADVVEAMANHRPYRPSLGIEAALQELRDGSGLRYDAQVVESCLRLFHEREFSFTSIPELVTAGDGSRVHA